MDTRCLVRAVSRLKPPLPLHRPFTTGLPTSADAPPRPRRPPPPPLPSNIARNNPKRDAGIALAQRSTNQMWEDVKIDRSRYPVVRDYDAQRAALNDPIKRQQVRDMERQMPRLPHWRTGDVYAPHDLSSVEANKWRNRKNREKDVFDILGINPLSEYKVRRMKIFLRCFRLMGVPFRENGDRRSWVLMIV